MDVDEKAAGVRRGGIAAVARRVRRIHRARAAIGEQATGAVAIVIAGAGNVGDEVVGLGFRLRRLATVGFVADVTAGATAVRDVPVEREIAVEVDAVTVGVDVRVAVAIAADLIVVLAPQDALLGHLAAVGVGLQHEVEIVVVDQPRRLGIAPVALDQPFGEARVDFGRWILARVDRAEHDHLRAVGVGGQRREIGEVDRAHLVALVRVVGALPRGADVVDLDESRVGRREVVHRVVRAFDGAVAREAGDRGIAAGRDLRDVRGDRRADAGFGRAQLRGRRLVDRDPEAGRRQRVDAALVGFRAQDLALRVDDDVLELRGGALQRGLVGPMGLDDPVVGQRGRAQGKPESREQRGTRNVHRILPRRKTPQHNAKPGFSECAFSRRRRASHRFHAMPGCAVRRTPRARRR